MATLKSSEFSGDDGEFYPEEKGGVKNTADWLKLMHRTVSEDENSGVEIVSERVV